MPGLWETVYTVLTALGLWYIRRGAKSDRSVVIQSTAAQSTSNEILEKINRLESDVGLLKKVALADKPIDHRAPGKGD